MRLILGLDRPTGGRALVNGRQYAEHRYPVREIGALLDATRSTFGASARSAYPGAHGCCWARLR